MCYVYVIEFDVWVLSEDIFLYKVSRAFNELQYSFAEPLHNFSSNKLQLHKTAAYSSQTASADRLIIDNELRVPQQSTHNNIQESSLPESDELLSLEDKALLSEVSLKWRLLIYIRLNSSLLIYIRLNSSLLINLGKS